MKKETEILKSIPFLFLSQSGKELELVTQQMITTINKSKKKKCQNPKFSMNNQNHVPHLIFHFFFQVLSIGSFKPFLKEKFIFQLDLQTLFIFPIFVFILGIFFSKHRGKKKGTPSIMVKYYIQL